MGNREISRYEEYCQFRTSVRGSRDYMLVGIDVATAAGHAPLICASGGPAALKNPDMFDMESYKNEHIMGRLSMTTLSGLYRIIAYIDWPKTITTKRIEQKDFQRPKATCLRSVIPI